MQNTTSALSFLGNSTIQLRLELGTIDQASQTTVIPDGETIDGYHYVNGQAVGRVGGLNGEYFLGFDKMNDSPIADLFDVSDRGGVLAADVDTLGRWIVTVNGVQVGLEDVSRKTHILDTARTDVWAFDFSTTENVFLNLSTPLEEGDVVRVRFGDSDFRFVAGTYAPEDTITEAIHVNLKGFDPDDAQKIAYLSSWNGWQVDGSLTDDGRTVPMEFEAGTRWQVVNSDTGRVVQRGVIEMGTPADQPQSFSHNYQGTDVWEIDFSSLDTAGTYHIVVDGVGRSNDFELSDHHWDDVFELGMSGFYHQRSGTALTEPYTDWERPRSFHPEDGFVIHQSTVKISDGSMGYDLTKPDVFTLLAGSETGEIVEDAWGGWHDAGDWDRRTPHIETTRKMMELWELSPEYQEISSLSIPESGDGIPDVLNEALWTLDFFKRLQGADGGVGGGVESAAHPNYGDGSWGESLKVYAYAADAWTTWEYAAAAAKMAGALQAYDPAAAAEWRASALLAMEWAEDNIPAGDGYDITHLNSRNLAAAELYNLTGAARWNTLYQQTTVYSGDLG
ncbi:MAG: glycoside hydrolase family 9 protein, partial [Paracoccaceae bacterium]